MRKTKLGIELPEADDEIESLEKAVGVLWRICCKTADTIDKLQGEIDKLQEEIDKYMTSGHEGLT
jgi:peptidoglycan hydrolase CwlO-like protein